MLMAVYADAASSINSPMRQSFQKSLSRSAALIRLLGHRLRGRIGV